jgi:MoaA/NifB/PqqE/SkfB family radical SAM enzyme
MDYELFKQVVDETCELVPVKQVSLVGFGEPLLYPQLIEAIEYVKKKNASISVILTSNGLLLNADWAHKMVAAGLDQMTISVNATSREQYLEINRADLYDQVVVNTCEFLDEVNSLTSRMRVHVQVLEGFNDDQKIELFRNFWKSKLGKCGAIQLHPLSNWAGEVKMSKEKFSGTDKHYPCAHLLNSWVVSREGNALACCMVLPDEQGDLSLGNVRDESLRELYMEGRIVELRKMNLEGSLYKLYPCKNCNTYKTVPNVCIKNPLYPLLGRKWI